MMYLVHKHTKEHRRYADAIVWRDSDCRFVQATPDGWIEWQGGECPLPDKHPVELRFRTGDTTRSRVSGPWSWSHDCNALPIIAYRPILDERPCFDCGSPLTAEERHYLKVQCSECAAKEVHQDPEAHAWDGKGLPPVGCECEYEYFEVGNWISAKAIGYDGPACVVALDGYGYEGSCDPCEFRPIRSEEDRAVDHMKSVAGTSYVKPEVMEMICRALYCAGYRKEES